MWILLQWVIFGSCSYVYSPCLFLQYLNTAGSVIKRKYTQTTAKWTAMLTREVTERATKVFDIVFIIQSVYQQIYPVTYISWHSFSLAQFSLHTQIKTHNLSDYFQSQEWSKCRNLLIKHMHKTCIFKNILIQMQASFSTDKSYRLIKQVLILLVMHELNNY